MTTAPWKVGGGFFGTVNRAAAQLTDRFELVAGSSSVPSPMLAITGIGRGEYRTARQAATRFRPADLAW